MKDFINIADFTGEQLTGLLERAISDKKLFRAGKLPASCVRKVLAIVFEKPSLRTRVSFEAAIVHLGGAAINLTNADIGLGSREPVADVAAVLGRMCDAVVARTFRHETVQGLAEHCSKPVINALTDYSHPCQAMADAMTAMEIFGDVRGRKLAFIGDGNNVARSLAILCEKLGMEFALACPEGYELELDVAQTRDPREAVAGASVIYTDTWVSMGQEDEKDARIATFKPYQVNAELLAAAPKDAVVMHCLPAYRGYEITDEVMSAHAGTIFEEAENRLHVQRTLLHVLMAEGSP
jgi:ornithine carbamoyltransferase